MVNINLDYLELPKYCYTFAFSVSLCSLFLLFNKNLLKLTLEPHFHLKTASLRQFWIYFVCTGVFACMYTNCDTVPTKAKRQ